MKPVILLILDGWGLSTETRGNAIFHANTPTIREIEAYYPAIPLQASGIAVGLPWGEAGNSEVGHLNIGSGRVVYQSLPRILFAIKNGSFFKNPTLIQAINHVKRNNSCLHLMGLVSTGNIHSYLEHLYALIELAVRENVPKIRLHVFTDGEDAPPRQALELIKPIKEKLNQAKDGKISTVIGRIYAMDRNQNWERTQLTYECLTQGKGENFKTASEAIKSAYEKDLTDTFIQPSVIVDPETKKPVGLIQDNDSVIFFNYRADRARQLTYAFVLPDFNGFPRTMLKNLYFVTMTEYQKNLPVQIAFPSIEIKNHITEVLGNHNKKVLKIAETEKYAHVTYFFNGGREEIYPNEKRILIPSTKMPHYEEYPEMSADQITQKLIQEIEAGQFDFAVVNYANPDIIGHTGNFEAAVKAIETVDSCLFSLLKIAKDNKIILFITGDHGNAEQMINLKTGEPYPEHTTNPVPFYFVAQEKRRKKAEKEINMLFKEPQGMLSDIAPTILEIMNIPQPYEMTGQSLLGFL